jgi:hypothetical protein
VSVTVTGHTSVTVVITRNCVGVTCPPSTDPMLTECVDRVCVDPHCSPATPELCPPSVTTCTRDGECVASGCGRASCASGACLVVPDDSRCAAGEICWGDFTCIPAPPDGDAGVSPFPGADGSAFPEGDANFDDGLDDAGPPTSGMEICTNGIDDDGDSHIDCSDPTCAGFGCDDGNRCTYRDVCVGGSCVGTPIHCTYSDICPADACIGARHCRRLPAQAGTACADGVNPQPCNGDYCDGMGHCLQNQRRPDGAYCGTGEFHCCAGLCVDVTSDARNCGGCGVHCSGPCMRVPTTNFGTCSCTNDANCSAFGAGAWCSPGGRCQCTCGCPRTGACSMRCSDACGSSTAICSDISGQDNYCFYPAP